MTTNKPTFEEIFNHLMTLRKTEIANIGVKFGCIAPSSVAYRVRNYSKEMLAHYVADRTAWNIRNDPKYSSLSL